MRSEPHYAREWRIVEVVAKRATAKKVSMKEIGVLAKGATAKKVSAKESRVLARVPVIGAPKAAGTVLTTRGGRPTWTSFLRNSTAMGTIGSIETNSRRLCMFCAKCTNAGWGRSVKAAGAVQVLEEIGTVFAQGIVRTVRAGRALRPNMAIDMIAIDKAVSIFSV